VTTGLPGHSPAAGAAPGPANGSVGGAVDSLAAHADPGREGGWSDGFARRVAAVDCGTNSLRLLIADVSVARGELADVQRRMEIVRLGQGVDATGRLSPVALARTLGVLRDYAQSISRAGATSVRMVATSATRDASNADEFVHGVIDILGVAPEVISGAEEARLSFTGATAELAGGADLAAGTAGPGGAGAASTAAGTGGAAGTAGSAGVEEGAGGRGVLEPPYLVVDIGGGSTEFVVGGHADSTGRSGPVGGALLLDAISVDIGCVRLTERYLHDDPPTAEQVAAATAAVDAAIDRVAAVVPVASARTLVGLAGSVTTVTAIALGLAGYEPARIHHARISARQVHEVTVSLLGQTREQRAAIGSMHPGRVDVIGAGALVLDRILTRLGFAEVVASEHDILDGIAWSIAADDI
jgi:exopolyphosphatase / guanosine-5'-triphosphate,3'-diphosphate pyrophosphatase